uniref:Uncharacterized protein At3g49055 n=1 Tax=Anthurium amnicola TaxID=1678845 RepID=A0A1D1YKV2_9ARAE
MADKLEEDPKRGSSVECSSCPPEGLPQPPLRDVALALGLEPVHASHCELQFRCFVMEETLADLRAQNRDLSDALKESSQERDSLRIKLLEGEVSMEDLGGTGHRARAEFVEDGGTVPSSLWELNEEGTRVIRVCSEVLYLVSSIKECFWRIYEWIGEEKLDYFVETEPSLQDELEVLLSEASRVHKLGLEVESKVIKYEEMKRKEKKDLENSILSLTEENSDISSLLRRALVEKEAAEKSLSKLKGSGEQRRTAIFQIAEWSLQKAGFGFMMGGSPGESPNENSSSCNASTTSDGSECEEDGVSLASTVEKIIKNLRHEVTELRCSLEEYRSENDHLQGLAFKQSQEITDSALYVKVLEERENALTQNVEQLSLELKGAEEEVIRWKEACELEVEAGKSAIEKCEREIACLKEDLERTEAALDTSNNRLKLKEKLATTAMAAQAAAETSLRLADSRSVGLRERIEELTRQLEEEAERSRREQSSVRRRVRHICWPWRALGINPPISSSRNARRRTLPDMVTLLQ